jgi:hypothetical protein
MRTARTHVDAGRGTLEGILSNHRRDGQPPIVMSTKTEGSLEFDLGRYEAPGAPSSSSSPPSDLLRTPLGWKAPTPSVTREEFEKAWDRLHGNLPVDTEVNAAADALVQKIIGGIRKLPRASCRAE